MDFEQVNASIAPLDARAMAAARDQWNAIAKPIGSLGRLETLVEQIAGIQGTPAVDVSRRCVAVLCADNGVVAEGVTQGGQDITTTMADCIAAGASSVCAMCRPVGIDVVAVDMGMATPGTNTRIRDRSLGRGTADIMLGPAMTRAQAEQAIGVGMDLVGQLKAEGYTLVATGEMGIGNTTTTSAMTSALLGVPPREATGKGAGLSQRDYLHKVQVVERAVEVNQPDAADPLDVLAKLGGFDIAGLVGMYVGGAVHRVPIIVDGVISTLAAYVATLLCPNCRDFMLGSHLSAEPAASLLMDRLGLDPVLHAGMHLGEGTGAVCLVPLLDMALSLYGGTTFRQTGIKAYEVDPQ